MAKKEVKTKLIKVSFAKLFVEAKEEEKEFGKGDLSTIIESIRAMPMDFEAADSRYYRPVATERSGYCLIAAPEKLAKTLLPEFGGYIAGAYLHRRSTDLPYEDSGDGDLEEIRLKDPTHELAEVTLFLIHKQTNVLVWLNNRYVSGMNGFCQYLTRKYGAAVRSDKSLDSGLLSINGKNGFVGWSQILNSQVLQEFKNRMPFVRSLDFRISSDAKSLSEFVKENKDASKDMVEVARVAALAGGANVSIKISADRSEHLQKAVVKRYWEEFKKSFSESQQAAFRVTGKIDDETRVLDLVSDKLSYQQEIQYAGKYPEHKQIFEKMIKAHEEYMEMIKGQL